MIDDQLLPILGTGSFHPHCLNLDKGQDVFKLIVLEAGECLPGGELWKLAILRFVLILQSQIFQHGTEILKSSDFRAKNGFGPNLKAGMDATILKESFATI